jgi:hypothetical protein
MRLSEAVQEALEREQSRPALTGRPAEARRAPLVA